MLKLIHDFIGYAFYNDVIGKDVDLVYKCYLIYCTLFGYDNALDKKDLITNICKEYNCMISKGCFIKCEGLYDSKDNE